MRFWQTFDRIRFGDATFLLLCQLSTVQILRIKILSIWELCKVAGKIPFCTESYWIDGWIGAKSYEVQMRTFDFCHFIAFFERHSVFLTRFVMV